MVNGRRDTLISSCPATMMNSERAVDGGAAIALCHRAVGRLIGQCAALMIWRTSFGMWAGRLSITRMSPGRSDGARYCGLARFCLPPHQVVHFADRCDG